ncbi:MAG: hypothetical protein HLUCCA04_11205 [Oceanicaulis sp. HLUCCA04]|nr:MAG: hypothetical protein HLUCCA04_11205 [Oceanicaulis sp. HLUCCA04]
MATHDVTDSTARRRPYYRTIGANTSGEVREISRIDQKTHQIVDRLSDAFYRATGDFNAYLDFRATRGRMFGGALPPDRWVQRAAQYPDSHIMHFSILAALILFEGLANAYFFSKASDLGLLGGWIQAITVAFTNVIAAFFLIGFMGLRSLSNPDRPFSFAAALVGVPIALCFVIFLNFSAAHYRDLLEINEAMIASGTLAASGEILAPVTRALTFQPFETLEALLLFILGITFAAIAAFKGATFDDRLIGYGAVQRRAIRSAAHLAAIIKQVPLDRSSEPSGVSNTVGSSTYEDAVQLKLDIDAYFAEQTQRALGRHREAADFQDDAARHSAHPGAREDKPPFPG